MESRLDPSRTALLAGTVAGIALTLFGMGTGIRVPVSVAARDREPPVARVNGVPIPASSYRKLADAVEAERPDLPLARSAGSARRGELLDRVVDEELLFQRAQALDLPRKTFLARKEAVLALVDAVVREAESGEPSAADLERVHASEGALLRRASRVTVAQVFCKSGSAAEDSAARTCAQTAARRLRDGEPIDRVARDLGAAPVVPLPEGPLSPGELRQTLGPSAAEVALALAPGSVSDPVRSEDGYRVLASRAREEGAIPTLAEARDEVRALAKRRAGERALAAYLAELRARAVIERSPP